MLQIDHVYEFLYQELFRDFSIGFPFGGVPKINNVIDSDISVFKPNEATREKIFFYDQEPFILSLAKPYTDIYLSDATQSVIVTSEYSQAVDEFAIQNNAQKLYYFFHGFAALDWYRGFYALNYNKDIIRSYKKDYISYNRLITDDRSYRIYFVSKLVEQGILANGTISFGVADDTTLSWQDEISKPQCKLSSHAKSHAVSHLSTVNKLVVDAEYIQGSASADIPRNNTWYTPDNTVSDIDALWHIVTETVFYYDKLHLTEKIFKPIVSKQPFMLIAAPGNLEYLRSYGFKTFDGLIDESYDLIQDPDARIDAVVTQLQAYCNLSPRDKMDLIYGLEPIIEYNFQHFYGEFQHIIAKELLNNTKALFSDIGYNDQRIPYASLYHVLTN